MAKRTTLSLETLAALGAERLPSFLMEMARAEPIIRKLRLAPLASRPLAELCSAEIRKLKSAGDRSSGRGRRRFDHLLADIADFQGDVDGFIAAMAATDGGVVDVLAVAERLIAAGRAEEAPGWLDKDVERVAFARMTANGISLTPSGTTRPIGQSWRRDTLRVDALEQLGHRDEAQRVRYGRAQTL